MTDVRVTLYLREWREARGMTQRTLAEQAGKSRAYIQRAENGKGPLTLDVLWRCATVLDVAPWQLATFPGWPSFTCACRCPCHTQEVPHGL